MNADGSEQTRLTEISEPEWITDPHWSPEGQRIAFASIREGNWDIYVVNADGSGERRLTTDSADYESPQWSPTGDR